MTKPKRAKRGAGDYPVGYAKPPAEHQFKKGQRRPPRKQKEEKPNRSFEDYLADELKEPIKIVENGIELTVPKGKALAKAVLNGAMANGDPRRLKGFLRPPKAQDDFDFSDVDLAIVFRALAQFGAQQKPASREPGADATLNDGDDDYVEDGEEEDAA